MWASGKAYLFLSLNFGLELTALELVGERADRKSQLFGVCSTGTKQGATDSPHFVNTIFNVSTDINQHNATLDTMISFN